MLAGISETVFEADQTLLFFDTQWINWYDVMLEFDQTVYQKETVS